MLSSEIKKKEQEKILFVTNVGCVSSTAVWTEIKPRGTSFQSAGQQRNTPRQGEYRGLI